MHTQIDFLVLHGKLFLQSFHYHVHARGHVAMVKTMFHNWLARSLSVLRDCDTYFSATQKISVKTSGAYVSNYCIEVVGSANSTMHKF